MMTTTKPLMLFIRMMTISCILTFSCNTHSNNEIIHYISDFKQKNNNDLYKITAWLNQHKKRFNEYCVISCVRDKNIAVIQTHDKRNHGIDMTRFVTPRYLFNFITKSNMQSIVFNKNNIIFVFGIRNCDFGYCQLMYSDSLIYDDFKEYDFYQNELPQNTSYWIYQLDSCWYVKSPPHPSKKYERTKKQK